jgi:hypothetical protein
LSVPEVCPIPIQGTSLFGNVSTVTEEEGVVVEQLAKFVDSVIDAEAVNNLVESLSSDSASFEYLR